MLELPIGTNRFDVKVTLLPQGTVLTRKLVFLGLSGCLTCNYLFPLVNFVKQNRLASEVVVDVRETKKEYEHRLQELLIELKIEPDYIPFPIPFILIEVGEMLRVIRQDLLDEVAFSIRDELDESTEFDFLDSDFEDDSIPLSYLTRLISETLFSDM